jgi:hypothetical protein
LVQQQARQLGRVQEMSQHHQQRQLLRVWRSSVPVQQCSALRQHRKEPQQV